MIHNHLRISAEAHDGTTALRFGTDRYVRRPASQCAVTHTVKRFVELRPPWSQKSLAGSQVLALDGLRRVQAARESTCAQATNTRCRVAHKSGLAQRSRLADMHQGIGNGAAPSPMHARQT